MFERRERDRPCKTGCKVLLPIGPAKGMKVREFYIFGIFSRIWILDRWIL